MEDFLHTNTNKSNNLDSINFINTDSIWNTNTHYSVKDLLKICNYYGIDKYVKGNKCKKQDIIEIINTAYKDSTYSHLSIHEYLSPVCWFFVSEQYDSFIYRAIERSLREKRYEPSVSDRLHFLIDILFNTS